MYTRKPMYGEDINISTTRPSCDQIQGSLRSEYEYEIEYEYGFSSAYAFDNHFSRQSRTDSPFQTGQQLGGVRALGT